MSKVVTTEIKKLLEIESCIIELSGESIPTDIAIIDRDCMWLLLPEQQIIIEDSLNMRIHFSHSYINLKLQLIKSVIKDGYSLALFSYNPEKLPKTMAENMEKLFSLETMIQRRKDERIPVEQKESQLKLKSVGWIQTDNEFESCVLKDISFSGCSLVCMGRKLNIAPEISKILLRLDFTSPDETICLLARVIRKNVVMVKNNLITELGLEFINPVNIKFEQRLAAFFE